MNESRKELDVKPRKAIVFISMIVMLAGLLFSRALLSSGLIVFVLACLIHKNIIQQLRTFFSSRFLLAMSLLFFLPLISGLWSDDLLKWSQIIRIKAPLLLLPICFASLNDFTFKDWQKISFVFFFLVTGGVYWSLWQYLQNVESVHAGYLQAHTLETPLGNDHIRFSLLVAVAILTAIVLLATVGKFFKKTVVILMLIIATTLVVYLHVLAVRTGLICFYIGVPCFIIRMARKHQKKIGYILLVFLILLLPVISWLIFPTFKNRISYLKYDLSFIQNKEYKPGSNDGNRLLSIRAGWQLQNDQPLTGAGFGDIKKETERWYEAHYPEMTETDKILPSSEWMMHGAGNGWPGFVLFSFITLVPFFEKKLKNNIAWWLLNLFMALSYLFDIGLEVQYGVFIHTFILLWWYKWLSTTQKITKG